MHFHRPSLLHRLGLAALAAFALGTATAGILPGVAATPAAQPAKPTVEAIPPGEIPGRADADERFAQEVVQRAQQRDPTQRLGAELDAMSDGIARLSKMFKRDQLLEMSAIRLESLEKHWKFYDRQLAEWRRDLQRLSAPYLDDSAELAARRAAWEATRASLGETSVATALSDRVAGILDQIDHAQKALSSPLDRQIDLGRRANLVEASIDAGRKNVSTAIAYHDKRLSMIDTDPLWLAWQDPALTRTELQGAADGLRSETAFLDDWGKANSQRVRLYQVCALLLLPFLFWLSRRSRRVVSADAETTAATRALQRPVSAWFVLLFVGVPFLFPDAPLVLHQLALLFALIPVLRLLPLEVYAVLGAGPYIATALYLLYRLGFLLVAEPLYYRVHLVAVAALTGIAIAWRLLTSSFGGQSAVSYRGRDAVRALGWLAVAALVVAIVANVIGNVSLAEMLCGAVLDSVYIGLALFAGTNVLVSMIRLALARKTLTRFRVVTQHAGPMLASITKLLTFGALVAWVVIMLNEFRIARPVFAQVRTILGYPLEIGQISVSAGGILLFAASVWASFWLAKTVRLILQDEVMPKMDLPRGVGNSISTLTYYALIMAGIFFALAAAGFELSQLALVVGALGVGIGLGLQNVVNNFVSGLILMFERPIQPGDVVEVSGTQGKVREIGMRATTLTTFEGADVVVPNGTLLSEKFVNWTLSDMTRRVDVNIGVAYGSNPREVMQLLLDVAKSTPGVAASPEPNVVFVGFGASSLDFSIRAWTHDFDDWVNVRSEMSARLYEAMTAAGIEIPFPQRTVHVKSVAPQAAGLAPPPPAGPAT
jgi:small-conductance mechanosensitive channel